MFTMADACSTTAAGQCGPPVSHDGQRDSTARFRNAQQCWLLANTENFEKIPLTFLYLPHQEQRGLSIHEPLCPKPPVVSDINVEDNSVMLVDNVQIDKKYINYPMFTVITVKTLQADKNRYKYAVNQSSFAGNEDEVRVKFNSNMPYFNTAQLTADQNERVLESSRNQEYAVIPAPSSETAESVSMQLKHRKEFIGGAVLLHFALQDGNGLEAIYYSGFLMFNQPRHDATSVMTSINLGYGALSCSSVCNRNQMRVAPVTPETAAICSSAIGALVGIKSASSFARSIIRSIPCELIQMAVRLPALDNNGNVISVEPGKANAEFVTGDGAFICNDGVQHLKEVHAKLVDNGVSWSSLILLKHVNEATDIDTYLDIVKHDKDNSGTPFGKFVRKFVPSEADLTGMPPVKGFGELEWSHEFLGKGFRTLEYTEKAEPKRRFLFMFVILDKKYSILPSDDYLTLQLTQTRFMSKIATDFLDSSSGDVILGVSGGGMRSFSIGQHFLIALWRELQQRNRTNGGASFLASLQTGERKLVLSGVSGGAWTAVRFLHSLCTAHSSGGSNPSLYPSDSQVAPTTLQDPQEIINDVCGKFETLRKLSLQTSPSTSTWLQSFLRLINFSWLSDIVEIASAAEYNWTEVMNQVIFASSSQNLLDLLWNPKANPYHLCLLIGSSILGDTSTTTGVRRRKR